ncbi:hypothetical protein DFH06DRAFT_1339866 [Mycena polygramma]|nr:hypothetical protein DFH06DRAFT_1339866 [Mycena polygramma]
MTDPEQGRAKQEEDNKDDEGAAAKLWTVYVKEAEKYDRGLVQSWKSDMEGLLIFAALFSAILTAFIIESYKSLSPDPGDLTVQLLGQISQQLAASANGSVYQVTASPQFKPTTSSLICNGLWFTSLGLSLACALIATLVQQWARDFLHKADRRSAPVDRARIFSYLYYGLKRCRMHLVVESIPLLLHASLLLFFGGLVAFLIPVDIRMTRIAAAVLAFVAGAYLTFTLLPLLYLDCPYHTPMSGMFWWIMQSFKKYWCRCRTLWRPRRTPAAETVGLRPQSSSELLAPSDPNLSTDKTMVEVMLRTATQVSDKRRERDYKALVWTTKSLSDDAELEAFAEAIPDVLWGPIRRRASYEHHILSLFRDPRLRLLDRIGELLRSCDAGVLTHGVSQRRQITCLKAVWALATLSVRPAMALDFSDLAGSPLFQDPQAANSDTTPYVVSVRALMARSIFLVYSGQLTKLQDRLVACELDAAQSRDGSLELQEVAKSLRHIRLHLDSTFRILHVGHEQSAFRELMSESDCPPTLVDLRFGIEECLSNTTLGQIRFLFLWEAGPFQSPPYRYKETLECVMVGADCTLPPSLRNWTGLAIHSVVSSHVERMNNALGNRETEWIDKTLTQLLGFWEPTDTDRIPRGVIVFLNWRQSDDRMAKVLFDSASTENHLWNCFPKTLLEGAAKVPGMFWQPPPLPQKDMFTALWRMTCIGAHNGSLKPQNNLRLKYLKSVLKAAAKAELRITQISVSVIAILKFRILQEMKYSLPQEIYRTLSIRNRHKSEAEFALVAEYLNSCCTSNVLPFNAVQTLFIISLYLVLKGPIRATHQLRLANGVYTILSTAEKYAELAREIVSCRLWDIYATGHITEEEVVSLSRRKDIWPWLDHLVARQKIKEAFTHYKIKLAASGESPDILGEPRVTASEDRRLEDLDRIQNILDGLDSWHRGADSYHAHGEDEGDDDDEEDDESSERPVPDLGSTENREGSSNTQAATWVCTPEFIFDSLFAGSNLDNC